MNIGTQIDMDRSPVVFTRGGEVFATSRDVAAFFEKEHRNVMQAIDNMIAQEPDLGERGMLKFQQTPYIEPSTGQTYRMFEMTRDGFMLLAMGFTGARALRWKMRYIEAFNAMEAELRQRAEGGAQIDLNDPSQLRGLLLTYADKAEAAERRVQELIPSKEALDRIAGADGSLSITDAAKALQIRPKDLFDWLSHNGWIYKRAGSAHWLGYQSKAASALLEHKVTTILRSDGSEKVTEQVRVTPKGLTRLAALIKPSAQSAP